MQGTKSSWKDTGGTKPNSRSDKITSCWYAHPYVLGMCRAAKVMIIPSITKLNECKNEIRHSEVYFWWIDKSGSRSIRVSSDIIMFIYIQKIIIVYYTQTSALPMRACPSGPAPGRISVRGNQHRTGPGPVLARWGTPVWTWKNLMMTKLHWLHFRRLFFLVVVSAIATNWP